VFELVTVNFKLFSGIWCVCVQNVTHHLLLYCCCFQGPALYAYNNAEFTDTDWAGLKMINDSVKKDDALKIGRFGLGFKSVFHMTG